VRSYVTSPTTIKAITEIPAKTPRPMGRTDNFFPGSWNRLVSCTSLVVDALELDVVNVDDKEGGVVGNTGVGTVVAGPVVLPGEPVAAGAPDTVDRPLTTMPGPARELDWETEPDRLVAIGSTGVGAVVAGPVVVVVVVIPPTAGDPVGARGPDTVDNPLITTPCPDRELDWGTEVGMLIVAGTTVDKKLGILGGPDGVIDGVIEVASGIGVEVVVAPFAEIAGVP